MIPIANLYYLLCYAHDRLPVGEQATVAAEQAPDVYNLLAHLLTRGIQQLLKTGIAHDYQPTTETMSGVKGKIAWNETIRRNSLYQGQTVCTFDELRAQTLANQLLRTALDQLLKLPVLTKALRQTTRYLQQRLHSIAPIQPTEALFEQARRQMQRQRLYDFLLSIAQLLHQCLLPNEQGDGTYRLVNFTRNERYMARLFEAFVRNFYRYEQRQFKVGRENIYWQFDTANALLPLMQTDVSLRSAERNIVLDVKYYAEVLQHYYNAAKFRTEHLYQLHAYLTNQPADYACEGILLYPNVSQTIDQDLGLWQGRYRLRICTLNLNQPWQGIHADLLAVIA